MRSVVLVALATALFGTAAVAAQVNRPQSQAAASGAVGPWKNVRVGLSQGTFDDVESVLRALAIPYRHVAEVDDPLRAFHVIFVGCGGPMLGDAATEAVRDYVARGGVLYASDLSCDLLSRAFPDDFRAFVRDGVPGKVRCAVHDKKLAALLGPKVTLEFDLGGWARPEQTSARVKALLTTEETLETNLPGPGISPPGGPVPKGAKAPAAARGARVPVLVTLAHGRGRVIYTSFHNHANASQLERKLIEYLVHSPVAAAKEIQAQLQAGAGADDLRRRREAAAAEPGQDSGRPPSTPLGLLQALEAETDAATRRRLSERLEAASPKFAEVKDDLEAIAALASSPDAAVAVAAEAQLANAFQRAPIGQCLAWLGKAEGKSTAIVWRQLDARIARADPARRSEYAQAALATLGQADVPLAARKAAFDLLTRLGDKSSASAVVEALVRMPRDLWPAAGAYLRSATGEDFGPRPGDGIAEVVAAQKRWQEWLRARSK